MESRQRIGISIVVPALNEAENLPQLIERIDATCAPFADYEVIIIDDHSSDETLRCAQVLSQRYPVRVFLKQGSRGKAQCLLEGFSYARHEIIGMIDADLQYPPEALIPMAQKLEEGYGIVQANRIHHEESGLRVVASKAFQFLFARLLHGIACDSQSGLKVFRKGILEEVSLNPSPWAFDLDFLVAARHCGWRIGIHDITFAARERGESKIKFFSSSFEIASHAIRLKLRRRSPYHVAPRLEGGMAGAGVAHKTQRFITHTTLHHTTSAIESFAPWQKVVLCAIISALIIGAVFQPLATGIVVMAGLSAIYFSDALFNLYIVLRSLRKSPELKCTEAEIAALDATALPVYSILCPLYKESEVLPNFLQAIACLDWPHEKLDVLLLLEENDQETIDAAASITLPDYVRMIIVPHSLPKTKPKACNFGLGYARGEYIVVYDAEDIPDPLQLKKAYCVFQKVPRGVGCLQAKLNYHNPNQNFLTRLFTAEYSLWFDITLTGLQSLNTYIPLGGTSNHFRSEDLKKLEGWDPFNVTEDCDLGTRLFKRGFKTAIIDSTTFEEANSQWGNWLRQRSRWIKGYMQTYFVHMRSPLAFIRTHGIHAFVFQLLVGGKIAFTLINPVLWLTTVGYFVLHASVGPTIEALFPPVVFVMAGISLVAGNFLFLYYYMIGCARRHQWSLIKYVYLVPLYWMMTSVAAYKAAYQLLVKPHYWEKTRHGLHFARPALAANVLAGETFSADVVPPGPWSRRIASLSRMFLPEEASHTGWTLMVALVAANVLNLFYSIILGRAVTLEHLGVIVFVNTMSYVVAIVMGPLGSSVTHMSGMLSERGEGVAYRYTIRLLQRSVVILLLLAATWLLAVPTLTSFFRLPHTMVMLLFAPLFVTAAIVTIVRGFLHGQLRFQAVASIVIAETVIKIGALGVFVLMGRPELVYLSVPISILGIAVLAFGYLRWPRTPRTVAPPAAERFPAKFYVASLITSITAAAFITLDVIMAKHYLAPTDAGVYSLLSLAGKIIYFLGSLPSAFLTPLVARAEGAAEDPEPIFRKIFSTTTLLVVGAYCAIGIFGSSTVGFIWGAQAQAILPYLPPFALGIALFALSSVIVSYQVARKQYSYSIVSLCFSAALIGGLVYAHDSVGQMVGIVTAINVIQFVVLYGMHQVSRTFPFIQRAVFDFIDAFIRVPVPSPAIKGKQRILIFNWRDTRHGYAGGAEVYLHEIARRLVVDGHAVTMFCGNDGDSARHEIIDGISIIRRGGFYFVYLWALVYYITQFRFKYDVIIDSHNGIPFFTPLYSRKKIYCLVHHVHQQIFTRELSWPLVLIARFLEEVLMPLVYRNVSFITVSESTRHDLERLGIGRTGIDIVNPGVNLQTLTPGEKSPYPLIVYVGRLKEYKSLDVLLYAFTRVLALQPSARLVVAGDGEELERLTHLAHGLRIDHAASFPGKISEPEKVRLLQQAWVFVNPSFMEGWGITTIEANACATPVIASNVPGLRDSVRPSVSGFLVDYGDSKAFAENILHIIENIEVRDNLMMRARQWASQFDWQRTSEYFSRVITQPDPVVVRRGYTRITIMLLVAATVFLFARTVWQSSAQAVSADLNRLWFAREVPVESRVTIEKVPHKTLSASGIVEKITIEPYE